MYTNQLLAKKASSRLPSQSLLKICTATDTSKDFVSYLSKAYLQPIRQEDRTTVVQRLSIEIPVIAMEYGATKELPDNMLKECLKLVLTRFSFLSITEIREAYRHWAAAGSKMYGGYFSVTQLAGVLRMYAKHRKKVVAAIIEDQTQRERAKAYELKKDQEQKRFELEFPKMLEKAKETVSSWEAIPEYWYHICFKRGMIQFKEGEANAIFQQATLIRNSEKASERLSSRFDPFSIISEEDKIKRIARKISVFVKIIKNQKNECIKS